MGKVEFLLSWTAALVPEGPLPSYTWKSYESL